MKKVILIFVLAAFSLIAVGQEPLFKKSSNNVSSKCIKGKIYTTYEYFDYYFYSGKTVVEHCDTVVQGKQFIGWYVVIRDTKTENNSITPKPNKKTPQTSSYMREI